MSGLLVLLDEPYEMDDGRMVVTRPASPGEILEAARLHANDDGDRRPENPQSCKHADSLIVQRSFGHRWVTCTECHTDFLPAPPASWEPCETCGGSGRVASAYNHDQTVFVPCPDCKGEKMPHCCVMSCDRAAEFEIYGDFGHPEDVTEACEEHVGTLLGTPEWAIKMYGREAKSWSVVPLLVKSVVGGTDDV